jgi:hypothetical protein
LHLIVVAHRVCFEKSLVMSRLERPAQLDSQNAFVPMMVGDRKASANAALTRAAVVFLFPYNARTEVQVGDVHAIDGLAYI